MRCSRQLRCAVRGCTLQNCRHWRSKCKHWQTGSLPPSPPKQRRTPGRQKKASANPIKETYFHLLRVLSSNDCVSLLQVISDVHADLPCSTCSKTFATTTKRDAHAKKCNTADNKSEEEPDKKPGRFPASCGNCEDFSCAGNLLPEIRPASCVTTCSPPKALGTTRSVAGVLRLNCHHC